MKFNFGILLILNRIVFGIREFQEINQMNIKKTIQAVRYCMQKYNAYGMDEQYLQDICMKQQQSPAASVLQRRKRSFMTGLVPKRNCYVIYNKFVDWRQIISPEIAEKSNIFIAGNRKYDVCSTPCQRKSLNLSLKKLRMTFSMAFGIDFDEMEFYEANSEGNNFKKLNSWSVDIGQCNGNCKQLDMELESLAMLGGTATPKTFCTPSHTDHLIVKFQSTVWIFTIESSDCLSVIE